MYIEVRIFFFIRFIDIIECIGFFKIMLQPPDMDAYSTCRGRQWAGKKYMCPFLHYNGQSTSTFPLGDDEMTLVRGMRFRLIYDLCLMISLYF